MVLYNPILYIHTPMLNIASAIEIVFLQAISGNVVDEDEDIILPLMVKTIPPNASLPPSVVISFSVTGGNATSKNIIVHTCTFNL